MMFTILLLLALPLIATGFTARSRSLEKSYLVTLVTPAGHLAATFYLLLTRQNPFPRGAWFGIDPLGSFFLLILSHTFLAVALYSPGFLERMQKPEYTASRRLYYPALNSYLLANTLVIFTQHFGLLWVVLELTTFSLTPLIYFYRSKESLEAVWKYLFLVSLGLVFLLIGILALGLAAKGAGERASLVLTDLVRDAAQLDPLWVKVSFVLALVGISAKIGLAPMHPADIDATSNAPGPVAALMAGSLRSTAMLVLLRFYEIACNTSVREFSQRLLMIAGAFSLLVAAVYIWRSRDYKRLLAYSSVEHLGIITLSTGVGGAAMLGALLHALFNSFGKIALFFMAGRINRDLQTREINSVHGLSSISIFFLMITECSRMPVDDPNTHLELTMIHEVMILDASGFDLMLYQHAASLKLLLYAFLISILLNPFGWLNPLAGLALFVGVLAVLAACLAAIETLMARFRLVLVPQFLLYATVIGVLNILIFTFSH